MAYRLERIAGNEESLRMVGLFSSLVPYGIGYSP